MYIFNHYINNRILRILLIALLIFCMVFGAFMVQYSYADLVLVPAIAVCATLLVACGVMSATDTDLQAVATAFHNSLAGQALEDIKAIAMDYGLIGSDKFTFKATKAVVSAVAGWLAGVLNLDGSNIYIDGDLTIGGIAMSWVPTLSFDDYNSMTTDQRKDIALKASTYSQLSDGDVVHQIPIFGQFITDPFYVDSTFYICLFSHLFSFGGRRAGSATTTGFDFSPGSSITASHLLLLSGIDGSNYGFGCYDYYDKIWRIVLLSGTTVFPRVTAQTDSTYFPKEVVDSATTTFPSNTASKPLTTETPLTIPQAGVNSTTMPGDVRTDADSPSIDVPLDTPGWLSKIWDGVCAIPDAIVGGVTAIVDAVGDVAGSIADTLSDFFNPSEFKLDFSKFKVGLTEVFPFCIPFDFVKGIKSLASDSAGYSFDIKLATTFFKVNHTVDLTPYRIPILFFRFVCDFWFGYILISRTRDWIKW